MGQLKPNAQYVYESPDKGETIYAREVGTSERILIGYTYNPQENKYHSAEDQLWYEIRAAAMEDTELQNALEKCKVLYYLKKKDEPYMMWYPV